MLRIIFLFISFCFTTQVNNISAQDVFELTYRFPADPSQTVYKGLLINNTDGAGFLRLTAVNPKTQKRVLYDFTVTVKAYDYWKRRLDGGLMLTTPEKENYWYCWSEDFKLKEGVEIFDFDYLRIWFRQDKTTKHIEPSLRIPFNVTGRGMSFMEAPVVGEYVPLSNASGNKQQQPGVMSFKQLSNASFTKTYLQDFFISSELISAGPYTKKQLSSIRNNNKPVLYLISVINSMDEDISENCIGDGKNVSEFFQNVASTLDTRFSEKKITGINFTITAVRTAIKNLHPGKDDIVVFFYSGHGFRWKGDLEYPFPQLGLYYGTPPSWNHMGAFSINMEDIFRDLQGKGARLNLIMSDCCNTIVNRRRSEIKDTVQSTAVPGYNDMNVRTAMSLFLQAKGSMLISAAEKGQAANCSTSFNGFFTTSLINTLRKDMKITGPAPQWIDIVNRTGAETAKLAGAYKEEQKIIYRVCIAKQIIGCINELGENTGK
ncbi:MAG: caspase family protein [Bacteroidota bacterium]